MTNPVSQAELMKALDDLIMAEAPPPLLDTDLTIQRLTGWAKCSAGKARKMIAKWLEEGRAEAIGQRRVKSGHAVDAWRLKEKGDK